MASEDAVEADTMSREEIDELATTILVGSISYGTHFDITVADMVVALYKASLILAFLSRKEGESKEDITTVFKSTADALLENVHELDLSDIKDMEPVNKKPV